LAKRYIVGVIEELSNNWLGGIGMITKSDIEAKLKQQKKDQTPAIAVTVVVIIVGYLVTGCFVRVPTDKASINALNKFCVVKSIDNPAGSGTYEYVTSREEALARFDEELLKILPVYPIFEQKIANTFSELLRADVQVLRKEDYIFSVINGRWQVNQYATAASKGFDAVIFIEFQPIWREIQWINSPNWINFKKLNIGLTIVRVNDYRILWSKTFSIESSQYITSWEQLSHEALKMATSIYNLDDK
jgi:hypothetical protein